VLVIFNELSAEPSNLGITNDSHPRLKWVEADDLVEMPSLIPLSTRGSDAASSEAEMLVDEAFADPWLFE